MTLKELAKNGIIQNHGSIVEYYDPEAKERKSFPFSSRTNEQNKDKLNWEIDLILPSITMEKDEIDEDFGKVQAILKVIITKKED